MFYIELKTVGLENLKSSAADFRSIRFALNIAEKQQLAPVGAIVNMIQNPRTITRTN